MKKIGFLVSLKSLKRRVRSVGGSGSISQRYRSLDPDPHQNFTDPQHWVIFPLGLCIRSHVIRILIQHFRLNTDPDPGFWWQKSEQNLQLKKTVFWSKTTIYLSLGLHKERPNNKSLQLSKENIQHFKTWNFLIFFYFCGSFLPSWIRIHWPDWIRIQSGSGSAAVRIHTKMSRILNNWLVLLFAAQVAGGAGERDCAAPRGRPRHRHRPHLRQALLIIYLHFIY